MKPIPALGILESFNCCSGLKNGPSLGSSVVKKVALTPTTVTASSVISTCKTNRMDAETIT